MFEAMAMCSMSALAPAPLVGDHLAPRDRSKVSGPTKFGPLVITATTSWPFLLQPRAISTAL
jgi:hypothetical protein